LLIILAAYFIGRFAFIKTHQIPQDFLKARQEASVIAQVIVNFSNDSAKRIEDISKLNSKGDYMEALNLVTAEMEKNREIRQKAISLSANLGTMAQNAVGIYPNSSASIAVEAITIETTLISKLVDYNDYLNQLLEFLRNQLLGKQNPNIKVNQLIDKINEEAIAINDLNQKFNELMAKFDGNR
jgi:DNA repair ATPase RecN